MLILAVTAPLAAPAVHPATPDAASVLGYWYSEEAPRVLSIEHYKPDGSFSIEFRECLKSGALDHIESGHWSISGEHFYMTTELVRDRPVHLTADNITIAYDRATWTRRISGGDALRIFGPDTFKSVRVTADSKLPGCDLSS